MGGCSYACLRGRADTGKVAEVVKDAQQGGVARVQAADAQPVCTPATSTGALTRQAWCMGALLARVPCDMRTASTQMPHLSTPRCGPHQSLLRPKTTWQRFAEAA